MLCDPLPPTASIVNEVTNDGILNVPSAVNEHVTVVAVSVQGEGSAAPAGS